MSNSLNTPSDKSNESLPRTLILSHRGWVRQMFNTGRRHHHRLLSLIELSKPPFFSETGKVAFFTPKKIGKAHDRNRVRRQMKEVYRKDLQTLHPSKLWIWLAKSPCSQSSYENIHAAMENLAHKAVKQRPSTS